MGGEGVAVRCRVRCVEMRTYVRSAVNGESWKGMEDGVFFGGIENAEYFGGTKTGNILCIGTRVIRTGNSLGNGKWGIFGVTKTGKCFGHRRTGHKFFAMNVLPEKFCTI